MPSCAKPCARCYKYAGEQDRYSESFLKGVSLLWFGNLACATLSFSAQACDQVAGHSLVAGKGPFPFLVPCPVRTLNSNSVPTHAYLRGASKCLSGFPPLARLSLHPFSTLFCLRRRVFTTSFMLIMSVLVSLLCWVGSS